MSWWFQIKPLLIFSWCYAIEICEKSKYKRPRDLFSQGLLGWPHNFYLFYQKSRGWYWLAAVLAYLISALVPLTLK